MVNVLVVLALDVGGVTRLSSCVFSAMVRGWWWIKDPEELMSTLQALHPRGIREKVLHKHLVKHMDFLSEMCTRPVSGEFRPGACT